MFCCFICFYVSSVFFCCICLSVCLSMALFLFMHLYVSAFAFIASKLRHMYVTGGNDRRRVHGVQWPANS